MQIIVSQICIPYMWKYCFLSEGFVDIPGHHIVPEEHREVAKMEKDGDPLARSSQLTLLSQQEHSLTKANHNQEPPYRNASFECTALVENCNNIFGGIFHKYTLQLPFPSEKSFLFGRIES